jgi:EEF1A lysine methyltransferase 1
VHCCRVHIDSVCLFFPRQGSPSLALLASFVRMCLHKRKHVRGHSMISMCSIHIGAVQDSTLRRLSKVLDLDEQWKSDPAFIRYDFHKPEDIPVSIHHTFDGVLVDPPFITMEVWGKYSEAVKLLLKDGGKIICTTIAENADLMQSLFGGNLKAAAFKPSIPNLIYQYDLYCNFEPTVLAQHNPELNE